MDQILGHRVVPMILTTLMEHVVCGTTRDKGQKGGGEVQIETD